MAPHSAAALGVALLLVLFTHVLLSSCQLMMLKGSVSCLDCTPQHDLSGVKLGVKCSNVKEPTYALTNKHGLFESNIPTNSSPPSWSSPRCLARILGGPVQLCARKNAMVSEIVKARGKPTGSYGLSNPLSFFTRCPSRAHQTPVADEKAPWSASQSPPSALPPAANLSNLPLIFLFPFIPIIGIP